VHEAELNKKKVCIKALRSYVQDTGGITKKVRSLPFGSPLLTVTETPWPVDVL